MPRQSKMVIVMRHDLGMRRGKQIAQGAHAVMGVLESARSSQAYDTWVNSGTTKVCVRVDSGKELLGIERAAREAGLPVYLVADAGRTEVEPGTITCLAIGPAWEDEVDPITRELKLL